MQGFEDAPLPKTLYRPPIRQQFGREQHCSLPSRQQRVIGHRREPFWVRSAGIYVDGVTRAAGLDEMSFAHVVRHPQGGTRAGFQRRALSADFLFLNTPPPGPPGATPLLQGGSLGSYLRAEPACPVTSVGDGHVVGRAADMLHVFSFRGSEGPVSIERRREPHASRSAGFRGRSPMKRVWGSPTFGAVAGLRYHGSSRLSGADGPITRSVAGSGRLTAASVPTGPSHKKVAKTR